MVPPFQFFRMYSSFGSRLVYNCQDLSVSQFQATLIKTVSPKQVVTIVPFRTISGNFLANPFDIFHKTVALLIQNDYQSLSFVKDIKGVGQKMARNGCKINYCYYSFR